MRLPVEGNHELSECLQGPGLAFPNRKPVGSWGHASAVGGGVFQVHHRLRVTQWPWKMLWSCGYCGYSCAAKEMTKKKVLKKNYKGLFFFLLFGGFDKSNYDFGPIKTQKNPLACIEAGHDVQTRLYTAASHHSRTHGQSTQIFQDAWQTARTDP